MEGRIIKIGCWNVSGANEEAKKQEIIDMYRSRKHDLFILTETKLKVGRERGKDRKQVTKERWEEITVIRTGVDENKHAKEGVAIMMSKEMEGHVKGHGCEGSRIVWVRLDIEGEDLIVVGAYAPTGHRIEDKEKFWGELNEEIEGVGGRSKVIVAGDLNARIGNEEIKGITGKFGLEGITNANGHKMLQLCAERGLMVGNTLFQKRRGRKYTWTSGVDGTRAVLDYILVDKRMRGELLDVDVLQGKKGTVSDHEVVEARFRIKRRKGWRKKINRKRVIKVKELDKKEVVERCMNNIEESWMEWARR